MRNGIINSDIDQQEQQRSEKKPNKKKSMIIFFVLLAITLFIYFEVFNMVMYSLGKREKGGMFLYNTISNFMYSMSDEGRQTEEEQQVTLLALGDIFLTPGTIANTKQNGYDLNTYFESTKTLLEKYDFTIANLNTPISSDNKNLSTSKEYHAPKELAAWLSNMKITNISTASIHAYDKKTPGIESTASVLKEAKINYTGSNNQNPLVLQKGDIKIGLLSYTSYLNVKITNNDNNLVNVLSEEKLNKDMEYLKSQEVDFILSYISNINEDKKWVTADQKKNADMLLKSGVDVVLGVGVDAIEEKYEDMLKMADNSNKHVVVYYSMGSFLGDVSTKDSASSVGLDISFSKTVTKDKKGNIIKEKSVNNMLINNTLIFYNKTENGKLVKNYEVVTTLEKYDKKELELTDTLSKELQQIKQSAVTKLK